MKGVNITFTHILIVMFVLLALIAAVKPYRESYLESRLVYEPTPMQLIRINTIANALCDHEKSYCIGDERVEFKLTEAFSLSSLPFIGDKFLIGETLFGDDKDIVLLPEPLLEKPSLLTVTLSHELLHVVHSDESLETDTLGFCEDHNRIKRLNIATLSSLVKTPPFDYVIEKDIHAGGNKEEACHLIQANSPS